MVLLIMIAVLGYTSSHVVIDPKYRFSEFEQVDSLTNFSLMGWEAVDRQSIIIQTSPSVFYLFVLRDKMGDLNSAEKIISSSTGNRIETGLDCIEPLCAAHSTSAVIESIYKLNGSSDTEYVKNRIRR
jgi:hypothetical protein